MKPLTFLRAVSSLAPIDQSVGGTYPYRFLTTGNEMEIIYSCTWQGYFLVFSFHALYTFFGFWLVELAFAVGLILVVLADTAVTCFFSH